MLGKLDKMQLQAYADEAFSDKKGAPFTVLINPESYTIKYRVDQSESQGQGTSHPQLHFNNIAAQDIHFDFVFDSTGVVVEPALINIGIVNPFAETANIIEQIETFKQLMFYYQSETHRPNFVAIKWGTLLFKGQMMTMDIDYKLFKPDGTPIRALARVGHRSGPGSTRPTNHYLNANGTANLRSGCIFKGEDFPGITGRVTNTGEQYEFDFRFMGQVRHKDRGVVASKFWSVRDDFVI